MKAFANSKIMHIYGDTTLEFSLTDEYRKRFSRKHTVIRAKNYEKNFEELCEQIGPPSRVMRWCCTVFKTVLEFSNWDATEDYTDADYEALK